jgi:two-component sensor histidine kinase/CheY-like chemotaxis protein
MDSAKPDSGTASARKRTVLAIDDDTKNLALLTEILKDRELSILVAEDSESGIARARYVRPDLILLDVLLPGTNGFETCRRLRLDEVTKDIPIIFMTALGETEFKVKGFESGGVDYITKPFQRDEVIARVGVHLRIRALTESLKEANESLGRRVAERTAELARANEELKSDIAERRQAEEALRASLEEKKMLLREVHHRVKNNLQIMASLVSMSLREMMDPASRMLCEDLANRIQAMYNVHEQIYGSEDYSSIDMAEYARRLAAFLYQSYRPHFEEVDISIRADPVILGLDQAIPFSLIIDEIMTNSLRHAFPKGRSARGGIDVELRNLPDSFVELRMGDDGIGLPAGIAATDRMGLALIPLLVGQLEGEMEMEAGGGTRYRIKFRKGGGTGAISPRREA